MLEDTTPAVVETFGVVPDTDPSQRLRSSPARVW